MSWLVEPASDIPGHTGIVVVSNIRRCCLTKIKTATCVVAVEVPKKSPFLGANSVSLEKT
jgi:hypothetical protein